jgi:hypothetical protein
MKQQWVMIVLAGALILGGIAIAGCTDGGTQPGETETELSMLSMTWNILPHPNVSTTYQSPNC